MKPLVSGTECHNVKSFEKFFLYKNSKLKSTMWLWHQNSTKMRAKFLIRLRMSLVRYERYSWMVYSWLNLKVSYLAVKFHLQPYSYTQIQEIDDNKILRCSKYEEGRETSLWHSWYKSNSPVNWWFSILDSRRNVSRFKGNYFRFFFFFVKLLLVRLYLAYLQTHAYMSTQLIFEFDTSS